MTILWTTCPDPGCRSPAEIEWRDVARGTSGFVEMAKVRCVQRHWFLLPVQAIYAGNPPVGLETS